MRTSHVADYDTWSTIEVQLRSAFVSTLLGALGRAHAARARCSARSRAMSPRAPAMISARICSRCPAYRYSPNVSHRGRTGGHEGRDQLRMGPVAPNDSRPRSGRGAAAPRPAPVAGGPHWQGTYSWAATAPHSAHLPRRIGPPHASHCAIVGLRLAEVAFKLRRVERRLRAQKLARSAHCRRLCGRIATWYAIRIAVRYADRLRLAIAHAPPIWAARRRVSRKVSCSCLERLCSR
jgi:hypothetical protein